MIRKWRSYLTCKKECDDLKKEMEDMKKEANDRIEVKAERKKTTC